MKNLQRDRKDLRKKIRAKRRSDPRLKRLLYVLLVVAFCLFMTSLIVNTCVENISDGLRNTINIALGSIDILSAFLLPVVSFFIANSVIRSKDTLEETLKIEDDHHKIICKYNKHSKRFIAHNELLAKGENMCDKDGVYMSLCCVNAEHAAKITNPVKDVNSDAYFERQKDINAFKNGRLYLPNLSVFTNVSGAQITFDDNGESKYEKPRFLQENAATLLSAHRASNVSNNVTIRLRDFDYTTDNKLVLKTERSDYIDMLLTNRCMDFDLGGMSVRSIYESGSRVSSLDNSKLCNQIGINGLVYTRDGYLLIEKRGSKKAVWKNKFAQPISLALKLNDVVTTDGKIGNTAQDAEACFKSVISKTLKSNFGLIEGAGKDFQFNLSTNFLGIARDLLEGGKPNLYFYVVVNKDVNELKAYLESNSQLASCISLARNKLSAGVPMTEQAAQPNKEPSYVKLAQMPAESKAELQRLIKNGALVVTNNNGVSAVELSADNNVSQEQVDNMLKLLDGMEQNKVDACLETILSKRLPKINNDKLDSEFYLVKRKDILLDYDYVATLPTHCMLAVQRKFEPCVKRGVAHKEAKRVAQYDLSETGKTNHTTTMHRECGEALLASLYYATVLDLEKRIENQFTNKETDND